MKKDTFNQIANREFEIFNRDTEKFIDNISISISSPIKHKTDWICNYQLKVKDKVTSQPIFGIDSFQALVNAIGVAKNEIEGLREKYIIKYLSGDELWI